MFNLSKVTNLAARVYGRTSLLLMKHGPTILVGVGVAGVGAFGYMVYKAARKQDSYLAESTDLLKKIHDARKFAPQDYPEDVYNKELARAYVHRAGRYIKLYGPALAVGAASVACILKAHVILRDRNIALVAAYKVLDEGFKKYRSRVVELFGPETDETLRYGLRDEVVPGQCVVDEEGKTVTTEPKVVTVPGPDEPSIYARFFDDSSVEWKRDYLYNLDFLVTQQRIFNQKLNTQGHVLLNEVYDALGIPRSKAGCVVGWVHKGHREYERLKGEKTPSDDYIDFGIYDPRNRDFANGYEKNALLDFNVDGVIYDQI